MKKYTKSDWINISILTFSFLTIFLIIMLKGDFLYISKLDYIDQHFIIPEYFRNLFYETKNLFPSLALNLGMGQNIFEFSYYGYLSPIILLSYLFPFLKMATFLQIVSFLIVIIDILLFYLFISKQTENKNLRFLVSFLFVMAVPLILHSHRHIMFVNYMPFLLLGLLFSETYIKTKNPVGLIICLLFIITTSYFFSIPALFTIFIYLIFLYLKENKSIKIKTFIKEHLKLCYYFLIPVLISSVLLIPTLSAILSSRFGSSEGISLLSLIIPTIHLEPFLYTSYSMGLISIVILAIINALLNKDKSYLFLGLVFSLFLVFPIFEYVLNGFMYLNGKVFIPFIPLALILVLKLLEDLINKKSNLKVILPIYILTLLLGAFKFDLYLPLIMDVLVTLLGIYILIKKKTVFPLIILLSLFSFSTALVINLKDELAKRPVTINQYSEEINRLIKNNISKDNLYRTCDKTGSDIFNTNNIRNLDEYKTTMYSSLTNKYYKNFYWNTFDAENPYRNDAIFSDISNPLFNIYFGNRYYIGNNEKPSFYTLKDKKGNVSIYENSDVFDIGYSTDKTLSYDEFSKLEYPYNIEALLNNVIVPSSSGEYNSKLEKLEVNNKNYDFALKKDKTFNVTNPNKSKTKLTIITFNMDYSEVCEKGDTYIKIGNASNMLTCKEWKYHNKNYSFSYVLEPSNSSNIPVEIGKGTYKISNIKMYSLDYENIKKIKENHDPFIIDKNSTSGDVIKGKINVTKDNSYFNLSIPYDKGYNIYVDKRKVTYQKTNTAFIGFPISKGYHNIEIVYKAPGLELSKKISVFGCALLLITIVYKGVKRNEKDINGRTLL